MAVSPPHLGYGTSSTGFMATGTVSRLGYALAAGVSGEYGSFDPGQMFQRAPTHNDVFRFTYGRSDSAPSPH